MPHRFDVIMGLNGRNFLLFDNYAQQKNKRLYIRFVSIICSPVIYIHISVDFITEINYNYLHEGWSLPHANLEQQKAFYFKASCNFKLIIFASSLLVNKDKIESTFLLFIH